MGNFSELIKKLSSTNREYQQSLIKIGKCKTKAEIREAIQEAENLAFELEIGLGTLFRKSPEPLLRECSHAANCVHFKEKA